MKINTIIAGIIIVVILLVAGFYVWPNRDKMNTHYKLTYKVYFPQNTATNTYEWWGPEDHSYIQTSYDGTNYLYEDQGNGRYSGNIIYATTAPIEVVSCEVTDTRLKFKEDEN